MGTYGLNNTICLYIDILLCWVMLNFCKITDQDYMCRSNNRRNLPVLLYQYCFSDVWKLDLIMLEYRIVISWNQTTKLQKKEGTNLFFPLALLDVGENNFAQPGSKLSPELWSETPLLSFSHFSGLKRVTACPQTRGGLRKRNICPFCCDRAAPIAPLLWKIILNSVKRHRLGFFPVFLPLSLQLLIRCLNLLRNNSAGKEIKGCWIKYEAEAVNCSNAYHFIQM